MAKEKYCPLTFTTGPVVSDFSYCREKSCAWWDNLAKSCAILVIAMLGGEGSICHKRLERMESIERARGRKK